jgi:hypothetical protein
VRQQLLISLNVTAAFDSSRSTGETRLRDAAHTLNFAKFSKFAPTNQVYTSNRWSEPFESNKIEQARGNLVDLMRKSAEK